MTLFINKSALELERSNVEVVGRSREIERLRRILSGVNSGFLPKLVSVYGPPGIGKTFVVKKICEESEKKFGGKFRFVYVNLAEARTVFSCANKLLRAVGGGWRSGRSGLDGVMEEFWTKVHEWEGEGKRFLLLVLDEGDQLFKDKRGDPSNFLYRLVRSEDRLEGSGIRLRLLTISNQAFSEIWELDSRVKSSMGSDELFFAPYSRDELKEILTRRGREAFHDGVVDPAVIDACVDYTGEGSQDVRRMIELLRSCGKVADGENAVKVEMKHYEKVEDFFDVDRNIIMILNLSETHKTLLRLIGRQQVVEDKFSLSSSELYKLYLHDQEENRVLQDALTNGRISQILRELDDMNIIGSSVISRGRGGRKLEVWLKVQAETMLRYLGVIYGNPNHETDDILERYNGEHASRRIPRLPSFKTRDLNSKSSSNENSEKKLKP